MDRSCLRIADVLLDGRPDGRGLVEIMDASGLSWTAVIHHLKHLERNSLVSRANTHRRRGSRLLYRAQKGLAELRERGWIPDYPEKAPEETDKET
jgi:DNA-binding transcriptional ArsR family regulator